MGRCQEFGPQIRDGCGHPMRPGNNACFCPECGVTCQGRYAGCPDVWARGPRAANTAVVTVDSPRLQLGLGTPANGRGTGGDSPAPVANGSPRALPDAEHHSSAAPQHHAAPNGDFRPPPAPDPTPDSAQEHVTEDDVEAADVTQPDVGDTGNTSGSVGDPRTHVLKWLEQRFDGLREEVQMLASGVSRQQATLDELLERQAELDAHLERQAERDVVGDGRDPEGRPDLDALVQRQSRLTEAIERQAERQSHLASELDRHAQAQRQSEASAHDRGAQLLAAAHDELAKLADQMVVTARKVSESTEASAAAQSENTERVRLLQTALTKQLRALTAQVENAEGRFDDRMAAFGRRMDALTRRLPEPKPPKGPTEARSARSSPRPPTRTRPVR